MKEPVWKPDPSRIEQSNMNNFIIFAREKFDFVGQSYESLYRWSIDNPSCFWEAMWKFSEIIASKPYKFVVDDFTKMPGALWFEGAELNFAENLLSPAGDDQTKEKIALVFYGESGDRKEISYQDLYNQVSQLVQVLRVMDVHEGDRVAAFMPNTIESVIGMLATSSLGAVWSSCSPDFGINGVFDRFNQIKPKVLIATDGYFYNGKKIDTASRVKEIGDKITSIESILVVNFLGGYENSLLVHQANAIEWECALSRYKPISIEFVQVSFNHPLYILYSSGTTGIPKCIVHSVGGTLIQHLKEHLLHTDLKREDTLFYFTTCGWMMWNWLVSGLAVGSTLVLYDGAPIYPGPEVLWDIAENERITVFGTSAKYLSAIEKEGFKPRERNNLSSLRTILSTGSPLSHESFDYVYRDIKEDVCLSSISGGTDIVSCFALGNPLLPVFRGELQCRGLGMAVEMFDEDGKSIFDAKGELVCTQAFPSSPVGFWNDKDDLNFKDAYFSTYDNVWAHGDYGELTEEGGVIIHGRSDSVLNPGGVRIGTAEIYRQVEKVDGVLESIAIGQQWKDDSRVVLFVRLQEGLTFDEQLVDKIKKTIRANATPRHVPSKIIEVPDIPRTLSGKIVEVAVRKVVHGEAVKNTDSLANPEALEFYRDLAELQC